MSEQNSIEDWRGEITEPKAILKLQDKEVASFVFVDEGDKKTHSEYGTSIVFKVKVEGEEEEKILYVNAKNFDLLGQIKELGKLVGLKVRLERFGSKRTDTRYIIKKEE